MKKLFAFVAFTAGCIFFASCVGSKTASPKVVAAEAESTTTKTTKGTGYDAGLEGYWYLEKTISPQGKESFQKDATEKKCNIQFDGEGKFTAFTGRNNLHGNYTTKMEKIFLTNMVGTKAMDKPWGANYAMKLQKIVSFRFAGQEMHLKLKTGEKLVFTRKKKKG